MQSDLETIPIFPLSNVVLFPLVQVPLHIFEPRYRQMTEECLAGARTIGMVTIRPEHALETEGDPPIFDVGCAGEVVAAEKLPDGRYNLVLQGTRRFAVEREIERPAERLYRIGEVRWLEDPHSPADAEHIAQARGRILELMAELLRGTESGTEEQPLFEALAGLDDATFVNSLCNAVTLATSEKQGLIEASSICDRFDRLAGVLSFRVAERDAPGRPNSGALH